MTCRFASLAQSYISHCKHLLSMAMIAHCDGAQLYCGALPCYLGAMMQSVTYVALDSCITQYLFVSLHFHLSVPRCNDRICLRRRSCSPAARHVSSCASPETTRRDRQQYGDYAFAVAFAVRYADGQAEYYRLHCLQAASARSVQTTMWTGKDDVLQAIHITAGGSSTARGLPCWPTHHTDAEHINPFCPAEGQSVRPRPKTCRSLEPLCARSDDAPLAQIVRWSYALRKGQKPLERLDVLARYLVV